MSKEIRISIRSALDAAGIEATKAQLDAMSRSVGKSMANAANDSKRHWADIKAAWDMGCAAIRKAWQAASAGLKKAFHFETQTTQFKTLIGNIDEAKRHMADLKALGDTPPFSLDEFAKASRSLMVMTDGALGYKKSLEMIGDAAAATGTPIEEMGAAVGRLYAFIRDGQPLSRAVAQLRNMGAITPEVAAKLDDLQKAGKSNAEIWAEVETSLGKYKGAMAETEKTGDGLIGAISSRWDNIVRAFGEAFSDTAKGGMTQVLDKMKEIEEDGTLAVWAHKVGEAIHEAIEAVKALHDSLHQVGDAAPKDLFDKSRGAEETVGTFFGNAWAQLGAIGAGIRGAFVPGESMIENYAAYGALHGYGKFADESARELSRIKNLKGEWSGDIDIRDAQKANEDEIRAEAVAKAAEKKAEAEREENKRTADEKKRIEEQLATAQKKTDEKTAQEAAKKKEEAAKKAADKQIELDRKAAAERERLAQKELDLKIKNHQKLMAEEEKTASKAQAAQSSAESKLQRAWGWYRDKDSMRAQMEEEKADAAAQKQFEKDFAKLKSKRRDWRTAENLSVDDEAVRRVGLAREEKQAADKWAQETAENTRDLAQKLDELLQMK